MHETPIKEAMMAYSMVIDVICTNYNIRESLEGHFIMGSSFCPLGEIAMMILDFGLAGN